MPLHAAPSIGRSRRAAASLFAAACIALVALALAAAAPARAEVKLYDLFTDHMVLQRGIKAPVWGTATPGEKISVTVGDDLDLRAATTTAGPDGTWRVELPPMEAGGPFEVKIVGKNTVTLADVLIGDVWVCSGQSNMEWGLQGTNTGVEAVKNATLPKLRLFTVTKRVSGQPCGDLLPPAPIYDKKVPLTWAVSTPESSRAFSAVGFFFGRQLLTDLEVPIGLIHTSWGGTPAEAWTSAAGFKATPALKGYVEAQEAGLAKFKEGIAAYPKLSADWSALALDALARNKPLPPAPAPPADPRGAGPHSPSALYNGMIAPLIPFAIKGAIWYQGESNATDFGNAIRYNDLFPGMITDWRTQWGQGDFPFLFVQLANYTAAVPVPVDQPWAFLRESQLKTLRLPKTGMAVAIDIGDAADIHPRDKETVGRRLALSAREVAYGQKIVGSGPIYESMAVEGDKVRLKFKHVGTGLASHEGPRAAESVPLRGFAIAGEDQQWVWAEATIDGNSVLVSSDKVKKPVAVRYNWAANPNGTLYNKDGLPASPFRTDDFPPALPKPAEPKPAEIKPGDTKPQAPAL